MTKPEWREARGERREARGERREARGEGRVLRVRNTNGVLQNSPASLSGEVLVVRKERGETVAF